MSKVTTPAPKPLNMMQYTKHDERQLHAPEKIADSGSDIIQNVYSSAARARVIHVMYKKTLDHVLIRRA